MSSYESCCATRFRAERERLKLSQADVYRATGISKQTLVAYESGASILYIRHKEALEELGFDLQLIYFEGQIPSDFDYESFFDMFMQITEHMQRHNRGVDRDVAISIIKEVYDNRASSVSHSGKVASAFLKLATG